MMTFNQLPIGARFITVATDFWPSFEGIKVSKLKAVKLGDTAKFFVLSDREVVQVG